MLLALSVDNGEVKLLEFLYPLCQLSFWLLKVVQPGEGAVICPQGKITIRAKLVCECYNS